MVRDTLLQVRLTPVEKSELARRAWLAGLTISDYVRQKAIQAGPDKREVKNGKK